MKKSVIILIAIIYVSAIAVVSFFGLQFKVFDPVVDVERIEILNEGLKAGGASTGDYYVVIFPEADGTYRFKIDTRVYPDDATNQTVKYEFDDNPLVTVDETGLVTFSKKSVVTVRIIATDGSNIETSLTIFCASPKSDN